MVLRLRKSPFKRNHSREKSIGDVFSNASNRLNSIMTLAVTIFTPALIATSIFSQEIIVMLVNISLCLGNLSNFGYRIYKNDVGKAELLVTLAVLGLFMAGAYFLFPTLISTSSLLGVLALVNQLAVGVNLFFLLRNSIVPPILGWCKYLAKKLGFDIKEQYHKLSPLDLKKDASILNALFQKHFGHSIFEAPEGQDLQTINQIHLEKLNQLLSILTEYLNKYDEAMLGEVHYQQVIQALQGHISQLTLRGNADSSYTFIKQKIAYKQVKRRCLEDAKAELEIEENQNWEHFSKYCAGIQKSSYEQQPSLFNQQGLKLLSDEIVRQTEKIEKLSVCLP